MKTIVRHQSQLLFRRSYKPVRVTRNRPTGTNFRPRVHPATFDSWIGLGGVP